MTSYRPADDRYDSLAYRRCGRSGLVLPALSLGLWHNFGGVDAYETARAIVRRAFDAGITHFDLANNYGPPPGSAEETFGRILQDDLRSYRDELVLSTKAGYLMWPGPYGDGGSRKYLLASLDQSLRRLGVPYVDIFYHHRPDPETPLEESMLALDAAVRQGKALYAGLSSYTPEQTREARRLLDELGTPCIIHQPRYNLFDRKIEEGLLGTLAEEGMGCIVFSPLAQGMLTDKYLTGIPEGSRAAKAHGNLQPGDITEGRRRVLVRLNEVAVGRGQTLAQFALSWVLRHEGVTSALVGVSRVAQLEDNLASLDAPPLTAEEIEAVERALADDVAS